MFSDPLQFAMYAVAFLASLTFHEFSHALAATTLGDDTAKRLGRLTLNPIPHIDPIGLLAMFAIGFGWAKPVPYNPYNLRDQKWGPVIVGAAGPLSNLFLASLFALIMRLVAAFGPGLVNTPLMGFFDTLVFINIGLCLFNLIPLPPLDGSKFLMAFLDGPRHERLRFTMETRGSMILILVILADSLMLNGLIFGRLLFGAVLAVKLFLTGGA